MQINYGVRMHHNNAFKCRIIIQIIIKYNQIQRTNTWNKNPTYNNNIKNNNKKKSNKLQFDNKYFCQKQNKPFINTIFL